MDTVGSVARFIKDNKLVSKGLGMIPHPGAQAVSQLASMVGLGRRKRRSTTRKRKPGTRARLSGTRKVGTTQVGRGIFSDLGGGIGNVFGGLGGGIGSVAHGLFGSGRKRSTTRRRNVIGI